jgi:hypothetical protein
MGKIDAQILFHDCGYAGYHDIGTHVARHHTTGSHNAAFSDRHTRQDECARTNPRARADLNREGLTLSGTALRGSDCMRTGDEDNSWANVTIIAHFDGTADSTCKQTLGPNMGSRSDPHRIGSEAYTAVQARCRLNRLTA